MSTLSKLARECAPQVAAWLAADPKRISGMTEIDQGILIDLLIRLILFGSAASHAATWGAHSRANFDRIILRLQKKEEPCP